MSYDQAFDAVLRERYDLLDREEIQAAERGRQGRLLRDDQDCYAIVDAFRNHRCHTDAFELAIQELGDFVDPGQTLCVVDLGAGAGNVAAALCETWSGGAAGNMTYIGVEPHSMMRRLGIAFLRALAPAWLDYRFVESCSGLPIPNADQYVVTLNYVVHQPGVSAGDLEEWAALLASLHAMGRTCVVSVSANSISPQLEGIDCTPALLREITLAGLSFDADTTSRRMDRRMPRADGNGWVVQAARGGDWPNVRIERYRLRDAT
jgi:SAM-dependent methyltransferase